MCEYIYVFVCVYMSIYIYVYIYMSAYICMCVFVCVCDVVFPVFLICYKGCDECKLVNLPPGASYIHPAKIYTHQASIWSTLKRPVQTVQYLAKSKHDPAIFLLFL